MGHTYFFTGFPGFLATALIRALSRRGQEAERFYLLVLPAMREQALAEAGRIVAEQQFAPEQLVIFTGDITLPGLGLAAEETARLRRDITHVFHLAAIYDLAVPRDIAYRVNVVGTGHVNDWVLTLDNLKRYVYFSTAYVSGTREGRILETELVMNQSFKNHYEETKYEAEVLVQAIADRVPLTVIRPGIVKGDSRTGETIKFDGPYFLLNVFDRLRFLPFIPYIGKGDAPVNLVPVDYIVEATVYLAHREESAGKTYHLTDPNPYTVRDLYRRMMQELLGKSPLGTIPVSLAKAALSVPALRRYLGVEREAMDYFTCRTIYDCTQAQQDLAGSGIRCPDFMEGIPAMVRFYVQHKQDQDKQLTIR